MCFLHKMKSLPSLIRKYPISHARITWISSRQGFPGINDVNPISHFRQNSRTRREQGPGLETVVRDSIYFIENVQCQPCNKPSLTKKYSSLRRCGGGCGSGGSGGGTGGNSPCTGRTNTIKVRPNQARAGPSKSLFSHKHAGLNCAA